MRSLRAFAPALAFACLPALASAGTPGTIECAVHGISARQQTDAGVALMDDQGGDVAVRTRDIVAKPAAVCARANHWSAAQTESAITWSVWALMDAEAERRSGLTPADLTAMRTYVDEDPTRIAGLDHFRQAQIATLIAEFRQRGAHLHDAGKDTERELGFLLPVKEMKAEEEHFAER